MKDEFMRVQCYYHPNLPADVVCLRCVCEPRDTHTNLRHALRDYESGYIV